MLSNYKTVVNKVSGMTGAYSSPDIPYAYQAPDGEVIVGFDFQAGWSVDQMNAAYTVPFNDLTAKPTKHVFPVPFAGNVGVKNNFAGGDPITMIAASGFYITSFTTEQNKNPPNDLTNIVFTTYNPATGVYGLERAGSSAPAGSNDPSLSVTYAAGATDALVGFQCYGSQFLGGFTQVSFMNYGGLPFYLKLWVFNKTYLVLFLALILVAILYSYKVYGKGERFGG